MRVHNFAFCNLAKIAMPDLVGTLGTVHSAPRARRARTRSLPQVLGSLRAPGAAADRPCPDPNSCQRGASGGAARGVGYQLNRQGGAPSGPLTSSCAPGARPPPQLAGATGRGGMYMHDPGGDGWGRGGTSSMGVG